MEQRRALDLRNPRNVAAIIACVALAATLTSLGNPFILDDKSKIVGNPDIRHLGEILSRLVYSYETRQILERNDPSRPVVFAIYTLVYAFAELSSWAYRIVNLMFHALGAVLVYRLLRQLLGALKLERAEWTAALAGLFFAVAPIQVGTAVYCYALSDVLSTTLTLLVLYYAVEHGRIAIGSGLFVLALFTKQSMVVLPVLVLLWDFARHCQFDINAARSRFKRYNSLWFLSIGYLLWRYFYFGTLGDLEGRGNTYAVWTYAAFQPYSVIRYLQLSLIPYGLAIDHYIGPATVASVERHLAMVVVVAACLAALVYGYHLVTKRSSATPGRKLIWFAWCFYVVAVIPTTSFVPTVDFLVERRVYLANVALALAVGALGAWILEQGRQTQWKALVSGYLLVLLSVSVYHNHVYSTEEGAWRSVLAIYPQSVRALNNLGIELSAKGRPQEAAECFIKILQRNPRDVYALSSLANVYNGERSPLFDRKRARALFEEVARINPAFPSAYYELGRIDQMAGQISSAEAYYKKALGLLPRDVQSHNNLGLLYLNQGKLIEARSHLREAASLDPRYEPAQFNLQLLAAREQGVSSGDSVPMGTVPMGTVPMGTVPMGTVQGPPGPMERQASGGPGSGQEVPLAQVDPSIIVPLMTAEIGKSPANVKLRTQYADYCFARKMECAKEQYQAILALEPTNENASAKLQQLK